jgi:SAM-dependent methyltransferase
LGIELDLLEQYPKSKRDVTARGSEKTEIDREIARKFGKEFFDGDRKNGYGGFKYDPKFWSPVVPSFQKHFSLNSKSSVLDVGCAKGFMIYDLSRLIPGITVKGIDISEYAVENALTEVKENIEVADAKDLPFDDNSFDVVISINTVHNLEINECGKALQ